MTKGWAMDQRPARPSVAEQLDYLFETVHPEHRGPYTYAEVAGGIMENSGVAISPSAIQQLRSGKNQNPKMQTIQALADFFGVTPGYFFSREETERTRAEVELLTAMRDQDVRRVALRASGLSTESLTMVAAVLDQARRLEGLPRNQDASGLLRDDG